MKEERYQKILELLNSGNYVSVDSLSKKLYVSMPTIRRDLNALQNMGFVLRNHGGAILKGFETEGSPISFRYGIHSEAKIKLAREASKLLRNDICIFMDESSTTLHIMDLIPQYKNISIVTNSLNVLQYAYKNRIPAYCLGGRLSFETMSFLGQETEDMVTRYGIDIMFFSSSGLNKHGIIVDYNEASNALRRKVIDYSDQKVFICDHSKFNKNAAYALSELSKIDYVYIDAPLPFEIDSGKANVVVV